MSVNSDAEYTATREPGTNCFECRQQPSKHFLSLLPLAAHLVLATMASKVRLQLVEGQTILPDPLMTLKPNVPVHMTIETVGTLERHLTTA